MAAFEAGDLALPELEREVRGVLRTYATEFGEGRAFEATGDPAAEGLVVLAESEAEARDRLDALLADDVRFSVRPVED